MPLSTPCLWDIGLLCSVTECQRIDADDAISIMYIQSEPITGRLPLTPGLGCHQGIKDAGENHSDSILNFSHLSI